MDEKRKLIVDTVLELFAEQGASFRMEDVAKAVKISKKTIYKDYGNKEDLISMVVEAVFEGIEHRLQHIMLDDSIDTLEKLIRVASAFPEPEDIDYRKAIKIREDFPKPYRMFMDYIEQNWQLKKRLFEAVSEEGRFTDIDYETYRIITLGIYKQVLDTDAGDREELLERCIRQVFRGFLK